jgi:hypothetical protein
VSSPQASVLLDLGSIETLTVSTSKAGHAADNLHRGMSKVRKLRANLSISSMSSASSDSSSDVAAAAPNQALLDDEEDKQIVRRQLETWEEKGISQESYDLVHYWDSVVSSLLCHINILFTEPSGSPSSLARYVQSCSFYSSDTGFCCAL